MHSLLQINAFLHVLQGILRTQPLGLVIYVILRAPAVQGEHLSIAHHVPLSIFLLVQIIAELVMLLVTNAMDLDFYPAMHAIQASYKSKEHHWLVWLDAQFLLQIFSRIIPSASNVLKIALPVLDQVIINAQHVPLESMK